MAENGTPVTGAIMSSAWGGYRSAAPVVQREARGLGGHPFAEGRFQAAVRPRHQGAASARAHDRARRHDQASASTSRAVRLRVMTDDSMAFSEQIRRAAGVGVEPPQTEEQKPEPPADPDFGAGARQATPTPPSMSDAIRAAWRGEWIRSG
jgi:hypothetical protein